MSRSLFAPFLKRSGAVILDGGLAAALERRGADLRDPLWSAKLLLEKPALIRHVHLDHLAAGAGVVTSASYQASCDGLAKRGLGRDDAAEVLRLRCASGPGGARGVPGRRRPAWRAPEHTACGGFAGLLWSGLARWLGVPR